MVTRRAKNVDDNVVKSMIVAKLILLSTVIAMIAIPVFASRARNGTRGLRWTVIGILLFNIFYVFAVRYIYPRLL
jgi:hypothetical protein